MVRPHFGVASTCKLPKVNEYIEPASPELIPKPKVKPKAPKARKIFTCPFKIEIDNQEKQPWSFGNIKVDKKDGGDGTDMLVIETRSFRHMPVGDYGILDEPGFRIERKSKSDMWGTIIETRNIRQRQEQMKRAGADPGIFEKPWFERQLAGLNSLDGHGHVIVECTLVSLTKYPPAMSGTAPKSIFRQITSWQDAYPMVHWWFLDTRRAAEIWAFEKMLAFVNYSTRRKESK